MKINQVEELVDITKKNIRFYEDQGLLNPDRNPENGYREYNLDDVNELKKIKLLRKLTVPIEEIKMIQAGKLSINECMVNRIECLTDEQQNIEVMKSLCDTIKNEITDYDSLDASDYLSRMKNMEKKGAIFMDIEREDVMKRSRNGALIATISAVIVISALTVGTAVLAAEDGAPWWFVIVNSLIGIALDIAVIVCMKKRMNEIKGGEEYEARKY